MAKSLQLKIAIYMCWFFAMTSTSMIVYAAEVEKKEQGLASLPFGDIKYCLVIIFFAGLLATLMKMTSEIAPRIKNIPLEIFKDATGSFAAGILGYLVVNWVDQEVTKVHLLLQPAAIFFAAFGGSRIIEPIYNEGFSGLLSVIRNFFARMIGRPIPPAQTPPPPSQE